MELDRICVHAEAEAKDAEKIYRETESIRAENLTFSYGRERILQDASMEIPKGAFCVITGHSGIGKSTLLKLLLGVFQPESGKLFVQTSAEEILLDRSTRRLFAYVPQGNLLLSGTLRENLLIAKPDATKEQLEQAIFVSAMDEYLPMLPHGLDTALGESGAGLSEGQAQRLAIARAVLGGAPILLLDESTSALDAQTEKMVLERIFSLKDRTCIAVTHRSAAEQLCDWKLEIRGGKIITIPNDK
jgi:ATP-binding cassette subfamily B protein